MVVEPRREFMFRALRKWNQARNFLEVKFWGSPLLKKLTKSHDVTITPGEGVFDGSLVDERKVHLLERKASEGSTEYISGQATKLAREWHSYGELPKLLQISGVNLGEVIQSLMMWRFFSLFRDIEYADSILRGERPDIIYIQSDLFGLEQAFYVSARSMNIKYSFFEPRFYRALKKRLWAYLLHKAFKKLFASSLILYSIDGGQGEASKYSILVSAPYINDFTTTLPVIQELVNRRICKCHVFGDRLTLRRKLGDMGLVEAEDKNTREHKEKSKELRKYYHSKLKKGVDFQSMFTYKGTNFWDAVKDDIALFFDRQVLTLINNLSYFGRIMDRVNPDILIVAESLGTRVQGHVLLAKQRGIPVLEIQHGIFRSLAGTPLATKFAAGGDYYKKVYVKFGAREDRAIVTGWPKYDVYKNLKDESSREDRNTVNLLFAMQPTDVRLNRRAIGIIGSFVEDSADLRLLVKPHPREDARTYSQIGRKHQHVILYGRRMDTAKLLVSSDVVITVSSTVGIEAALLDKPIICINVTNEESLYVSSGVAIEVSKLDDLIPAIKDALYNEEVRAGLAKARKKFVYEHTYIQDAQASKRVADLIIQMIEKSKKPKGET